MTYSATIDRIIDREVLVNASQMISELGDHPSGPVSIDALMECCIAPDWSEAPNGYDVQEVLEPRSWMFSSGNYSEYDFDTELEAIQAAWDDAGDKPDQIEALQHWIVTDWLAEKLEAVGALVAHDILGFAVWGRTECGQSLTMDSDLLKVAALIDGDG